MKKNQPLKQPKEPAPESGFRMYTDLSFETGRKVRAAAKKEVRSMSGQIQFIVNEWAQTQPKEP